MSPTQLQRKPLFAAAKKNAELDESRFLSEVFRAVMDRQHDTLVGLLRRPGSATLLRRGFQADSSNTQRASFVDLCVLVNNLAALRAVLEAGVPGVTLADCSTVELVSGQITVTTWCDLPETSVDHGDPEGLAIALEFDPGHRSFTSVTDKHHGTLHYGALTTVVTGATRDLVERVAQCCSVLIPHIGRAPCASDLPDDDPIRRLFIVGRYGYDNLGTCDIVLQLFHRYIEAGLFDIDRPFAGELGEEKAGCTPLEASIRYGNGPLSAALIDLGCDLDAARGEFPDVLALAESAMGQNSRSGETFAAVTEAVMRRRLREHDAARALAGAAAAAPAPARRAKVL